MRKIFFRRKKSKDLIERASSAFVEEEYRGHKEDALEEVDMSRILKELRNKIADFERIREELRAQIESSPILLPRLGREKELFRNYVRREQEKMSGMIDLVDNIRLTLKSWTEEHPGTMSISPHEDRLFPF